MKILILLLSLGLTSLSAQAGSFTVEVLKGDRLLTYHNQHYTEYYIRQIDKPRGIITVFNVQTMTELYMDTRHFAKTAVRLERLDPRATKADGTAQWRRIL